MRLGDKLYTDMYAATLYRVVDHEGDIGFEIFGRDEEELFRNGAAALFSMITDLECVEERVLRRITVADGEDLLILFLNELLYLWDVHRFIPKSMRIDVEKGMLHGDLKGEIFDPERHRVRGEVKAVTYHKFAVSAKGGVLKATIILDI